MFSPLAHRLHELSSCASAATVSRHWLRPAPAWLARNLPLLGSVLYAPMQSGNRAAPELPRGLVVESRQWAVLLQSHWWVSASTITADGPREWIECVDSDGRLDARLHLLPDTDYLAWDALLAGAEPIAAPPRWVPSGRPAAAQLLRFHLHQLAGLYVFGSITAAQVSPLGQQLAAQIAHAEARAWR